MNFLYTLGIILAVFVLLYLGDQLWMRIVGTPIDHHSRNEWNKKG